MENVMNNMDNFDSRALHLTDAYGQRFMREGTFKYCVAKAGLGRIGSYPVYTITVESCSKDHKMEQHSLQLKYEAGQFIPERQDITIQLGDLVMWSCRQPTAPAFEVIGEQEFFNSVNMANECGYAHAFCSPGKYHWADANGSGLSGVIEVSNPDCKSQKDMDKWQKKLAKGSLVMINGNKAEPSKIKVLTGQTVYFAIIKTEGISITDQRLIDCSKNVDKVVKAATGCSS
jgi:plastocyanin